MKHRTQGHWDTSRYRHWDLETKEYRDRGHRNIWIWDKVTLGHRNTGCQGHWDKGILRAMV